MDLLILNSPNVIDMSLSLEVGLDSLVNLDESLKLPLEAAVLAVERRDVLV